MTDSESFVERMGLAAESDGLSRIAGRLFGALTLHSEPQSLDDLADQLAVSKASVSTEARRLVERGVAERIGKPGDRRDYYSLTPDFFAQIIRFRLSRWAALHRIAREMQTADQELPRLVRDRFAYIDDVNAFVLARVDDALREWSEREREAASSRERRGGSRQERGLTPKAVAKRQTARERLG
ncbi:MAG TPA: MarR family transcriptional regulator [Gemmatimonadaceae bacterium]|jgi:DNA-binding transcriptional regulator GbsR (MarR family)